ncbi:Hypothetical predicted protein [Mytilus galloprovincialis]|uniref:Peptidase A2 domain-containing protein n=1 Tax=Mytilus galloprovincialis TaxID=29158 RepID=A0A8B6BYD9_MYTGA|nr:Hypothetical predicted protein [Mytilus galloprovincialis]
MYDQPNEQYCNARYDQHYNTYDTFDPQYYPPRRKRRRHRRRNRQRPYWDQIEAEYQPAPTPTYVSQPSREPVYATDVTTRPYAFACCVRLDHTRKACNFQQMNTEAKMYQQRQSSGNTEGLLGSPNEVTVVINGFQAAALLDTGSTVSTVSQSFHRQYLADSPIQTLNQILNIECADGQNMPYLGYISAALQLPELLGRTNTSNISTDSVKAICQLQHAQPYVQTLSMTTSKATDDPYLPSQHLVNIKMEQKQDTYLKDWIYWVDEHRKPRKEQLEPTRNIFAAQKRQKTHYDQKVKGAVLKPGDRVLVKTLAFDGKHKLADRWEDDPYRIISQPNCGIPVYVVQKENKEGRKRTLHRNLFLPIGDLPKDIIDKEKKRPAPRQRRKKQPEEPAKSEGNSENRTTDEVSDEESEQEYGYYILDQDTQDNTNSDVPVVDLQEGTLGFTGDGHDGAESSDQQGTGLGGDALPVDIIIAAEPNPVSDEDTEEATAQTIEEHTSIDQDESAPTDLSLEQADEPTIAPEQQPRIRRRRILPTPPRDPPVSTRPQRERKQPKYLDDYVVSKQATTIQQPDWLMRIHWLESEARKGRFKGLEMELSRTILDIMRTS